MLDRFAAGLECRVQRHVAAFVDRKLLTSSVQTAHHHAEGRLHFQKLVRGYEGLVCLSVL